MNKPQEHGHDNAETVYLKREIKLEPLVANWYAWAHLVSPVTYALNMVNRHIPAMEALVKSPESHDAFMQNPDLAAGSILRMGSSRLAEVSDLLARTRTEGEQRGRFVSDYFALDKLIAETATGDTLEVLYKTLPPALQGLVELHYGLDNHPGIRIFEELAKTTPLGTDSIQQINFHRGRDIDRAYFLNTPRFTDEVDTVISTTFNSPWIDLLASSRTRGALFGDLYNDDIAAQIDRKTFSSFFSTQAESTVGNGPGKGALRLRYLGHACTLVESDDFAILVDPVIAWDKEDIGASLTFDDLPEKIDYVFITHAHHDHLSIETLLQLRHRIGTVLVPANNPTNLADPSIKSMLESIGFSNVIAMNGMDRIPIDGGELISLPFLGEHADLSIFSKHGACIKANGKTFMFLADSSGIDPEMYRHIRRSVGNVDMLFIGMECGGAPLKWLYSPYFRQQVKRSHNQTRRLNGADCERAAAIADILGCDEGVYVYALGQEPWVGFLFGEVFTSESIQIIESDKLVARYREKGVESRRLLGCEQWLFNSKSCMAAAADANAEWVD